MERGEIAVRITKSLTKNLGNYNSARIEYSMEKIVPEKEEANTVQELSNKIDAYVEDEFAELEAHN